MNGSSRSARVLLCAAVALTMMSLAAPCAMAGGSDYGDKDFSVRLPPAFVRFTEVSTLGGETVANRYSSASNPASAGWLSWPSKYGLIAAPYYSQINFDSGMRLHLYGQSVTWDSGQWGVFQPTLSQIRTDHTRDRQGMTFDYSVDTAQLQWGKRYGNLGVGADFNFARARIERNGVVTQNVMGQAVPARVDTDSTAESYRWRLGGLWQPADKWLTGLIFEYGFQPFRSKSRVTIPMPEGMPAVTKTIQNDGTQQQYILRPGVSYEYAKMSTIYVDYQYGNFISPRDHLISHRFNAGVDHRVFDWLMARVGPSIDVRGNVGISCGLSAFLSTWCSLNVGYQYNMLPEIEREFGRAQTIQAALAFRF